MHGREREQGRTHGPQDVARPPGEQQAGGAAQKGQDDALDQQLTDEAPAVGAHGQPHRDLLSPSGPPRQQQIRHVAAGDQQHKRGDDPERGACLGDSGPVSGADGRFRKRRQLHAPPLVVLGVFALEVAHESPETRFGLPQAHSRLQSSHNRKKKGAALVHPSRVGVDLPVHHHRNPNLPGQQRVQPLEPPRRHPHDAVCASVQLQAAADYPGIAAELPHPQAIADHGHRIGVGDRILFRGESTAGRHRDAERLKVVAGHHLAYQALRFAMPGQVQADGGVQE
jgi:hypothetical protein